MIPWLVCQAAAAAWLLACWRAKRTARLLLAVLFLWAAFTNASFAWRTPAVYLDDARFTWSEAYRAFILGWFSSHIQPMVLTIAAGQLLVAILVLSRGVAARLGLVGAVIFLLAITPLGFGAGFPFPLLIALGSSALWRSVDRPLPGPATAVWLGMLVLAFVNGALRELVLVPAVGEPWAHHLSALTAIGLFTALVWTTWPHLRLTTPRQAARTGAYWLVLTFLAETWLVGRVLGGRSWPEVFAAYDVTAGSSWPLVLVWLALLPTVVALSRHEGRDRSRAPQGGHHPARAPQ